MKKTKVLYIVGYGRSGSTLLNLILGSSPKLYPVGEVAYLKNRLLGLHVVIERAPKKKLMCSCGKEFSKCDFWKNVVTKIGEDNLYWYKIPLSEKFQLFAQTFLGGNKKGPVKCPAAPLYDAIITGAQKSKPTVEGIADASKNLWRLAYLNKEEKLDLTVIHLVRDGRAIVKSLRTKSPTKGMISWLFWNTMTSIYLKRNFDRKEYMRISYDEFAQNPKKFIKKINEKFDLKIDDDRFIEKINSEERHIFAGNGRVWNTKLEAIRYDQSWRQHLPKWKQYILSFLFYVPNKIWVYND